MVKSQHLAIRMTEIEIVNSFPHKTTEIENTWIVMSDGCRLAARIWLPEGAADNPVPAILEYLPYRKRDGTYVRDALTYPYFAGHGYAGVRVDMRGNGESDGLMFDEYLKQEQDDALEVIEWLTQQPWCDGNVGMMGISWGGFNGLQVAARQPPALKAVISLCSTDDRYADDIHYKGGALLMENLGWASTMLSYSSRPPDPALAGESWRDTWMQRLENTPLLIDNWLQHQRRDAFWKHGSICEDWSDIQAAVLLVGGWHDAYSNTIPRMLEGLQCPVRGINGPWAHKYPHFAVPDPKIGFLQEALRWWNHWLKGIDSGVMDDPLYRAYLMDSARPQASYAERPGRWLGVSNCPSADTQKKRLYFGSNRLSETPCPDKTWHVKTDQDTGTACGEFCIMWLGPDWPTDQRNDDAHSLCFDMQVLDGDLSLFGAPETEIELRSDKPQSNLIVRLCDVWPDGASTRISIGVLNLCHRDSHEHPEPLQEKIYKVKLKLDDCAYVVPKGHKLRVAVSNAYWPLIWPSPEAATLTLNSSGCHIDLPVYKDNGQTPPDFPPPQSAPPQQQDELRPAKGSRTVTKDFARNRTIVTVEDDFGRYRIHPHNLIQEETNRETHSINPDNPTSAYTHIHGTQILERGDWKVRTETFSEMWSDNANFYIKAKLQAFERDKLVFETEWNKSIERQFV